jgi:hypothetical protein
MGTFLALQSFLAFLKVSNEIGQVALEYHHTVSKTNELYVG